VACRRNSLLAIPATIAVLPAYLQLRVELQHVRPAIWRRFLIRPDANFAELHDAIQTACGWEYRHLYSFHAKTLGPNPIAGVPDRISAIWHGLDLFETEKFP